MKKLNLKTGLIISFILMLFAFAGCQKENPSSKKDVQNIEIAGKMSLQEFENSVTTPEEKYFFQHTKITDNSSIAEKLFNEKATTNTLAAFPIKVKFKWGKGCVRAIGICVIIPIDKKQAYTQQTNSANAEGYKIDNKYIIVPLTDDNGLTSDGYLPLYDDIAVDENTIIKAGIYRAYYDSTKKQYEIVTDLK